MLNTKAGLTVTIIKMLFLGSFVQAQLSIRTLEIDSIIVAPANPTSDDPVRLIAYSHAFHGSCLMLNSSVNIFDTAIGVEAEYNKPGFTVECFNADTFNLGKLCPGTYTLRFRPYAMTDVTSGNPPVTRIVKTYLDTAVIFFMVTGVPGQYPINLPEEISMCEDNVILDAGFYPGIDYIWNTGEISQQINVMESGRYIVTLYKGRCEMAADTSLVTSDCELYFPNTFTPNNDGINDIFGAKGVDIYNFEIHIYNRWGILINISYDLRNCWDGHQTDIPPAQGIYLWKACYSSTESPSSLKTRIGHITLLR